MKIKFSIILLCGLLVGTYSYSQIKFGICGGFNSAVYKSGDILTTSNNYKISFPSNSNSGFHLGLISQAEFLSFFIQPELEFSKIRHSIDIQDKNPSGKNYVTLETINRIDIPVLVGYKFSVIKLEAGPVASFIVSNNSDLKKITTYEMQFNNASFGFQAGVGLQVTKLIVDLKYEVGLNNSGKSIASGNNEKQFNSHIRQFVVNVGILL